MYFDDNQEDIPKTVRRRKKQLYESIRERMEFYFSDANVQKDRFLSQLIKNDPQVDLEIFLRFNRIKQLTNSLHDLKKALKKSEILELNEDKTKVFRKTPVKEKTNVDACTIYVEQLSSDVDHDWLKLIFSRYGKVDYISIPKYRNTGKIKGFAFVEFETPESAKAALDEFEREGCCLISQMNPENLCSIATYEDDKFDSKNQLGQQNNDGTKINKFQLNPQEENESKIGKKRKFEDCEEKEEESTEKNTKSKKHSKEPKLQSGEESFEKSCNEDNDNLNNDKNKSYDENNGNEIDVPTKKKKNRKKKKSLKTKYVKDVKMLGLQILSKADWKRLRNKYLNVQKEKMKKIKQHLYKSQTNHSYKQQQQPQQMQPSSNNQNMETSTKPRFQFVNGVVIKVVFEEPIKDSSQVTQFKCDAKSLKKVEYVDVEIGSKEGYIRFGDPDAVQEILKSKPWENMSLLKGDEEINYWEKMKKDRSEKFENKKKFKKKRGRNKIIDKTEKLMSKKIRLSVDE